MRTARTLIASLFSTRGLFVIYRALGLLVVDYPCIADMHGMYFCCQPTMDIVVYRASDMHGMYFHILARHSSIRHGVYLLLGVVYYAGIRLLFSSSSGGGIALWASAVDAHLFLFVVPFPTERFMNGNPSPV